MNDINFIKKAVPFAEDFTLGVDGRIMFLHMFLVVSDSLISGTPGMYSLLLQRAIEGINEQNPEWQQIVQCAYAVQILTDSGRDVVKNFNINKSIDDCKREALEYIFKQDGE